MCQLKAIKGLDHATNVIGQFSFNEFRIVRRLDFYDKFNDSQCIDLIVESESRSPNYQLTLHFSGVTDFRLNGFGGGETRIIGLDILDIRNRGWEKVFWEICDYENDGLHFLSEGAEIILIDSIARNPD